MEGVRGRNRPDVVYQKIHGYGGDGTGAVHIAEIDARHGEVVAGCGSDGDDKNAWVAATPYDTIGRRWEIPQKPSVTLVVYVPALSAAAAVRIPILEAARVYHERPNAMTVVIHVLKRAGSGGEGGSIELGDEVLTPHWLGNTDDMELDIAEAPAYPKHWSNAGWAGPRSWAEEDRGEEARVQGSR